MRSSSRRVPRCRGAVSNMACRPLARAIFATMFLFRSHLCARIFSMARPSAARRPPASPTPSSPPPAGASVRHGRAKAAAPWRPATVDLAAPANADVAVDAPRRRGRGAQSNAAGRYELVARIAFDDGWQSFEELPPFKTTVTIDSTRKIITRNESPDISFDRSINPYRGCEHGCIYCFARPTHAYLGLSPGLDFETKLFAKPEAPKLLERELAAEG